MALTLDKLKKILPVEPRADLLGNMHHLFIYDEPRFFFDGILHQLGFRYIDGFLCEPLLMVWLHPRDQLILSYCEGDLYLYEAPNIGDWMEHTREAVDSLASQFDGAPVVDGLTIL